MAGEIEKFILGLGFDDKEALKDFKSFVSKMDAELNKHSAKTRTRIKKEHDEGVKADKSRADKKVKAEQAAFKKISRFRHSANIDTIGRNDPARARGLVSRYKSAVNRGDIDLMNSLSRESANVAAAFRRQERRALSLRSAQRGLQDSTRNLIRSFVSLYALYEGTNAINLTGQAFESLNSAMLAAMGTQGQATTQIDKLDKLTSRLGLSLIDTADQYTKFVFASKGKLPLEEVDLLFEGMAELGTTLGVSKDRMKLSFTAIQQMMNKGTITSEELKRQLAESLPGAIQIFARSIGKSEAEMFKMMENGELLAEDVLPKVAYEMKRVANSGGALELKYKTTRVAQGRFFKELETGKKKVFGSGFDEGLAGLFNELSESIGESQSGLEGLGKIYQLFFTILKNASKVIIPILDSVAFSLGKISEVFTFLFETKLGTLLTGVTAITLAMLKLGTVSGVLNTIWKSLLLKMTLVAGIFDEVFSFFDEDRTNVIEQLWGMEAGQKVSGINARIMKEGGKVGGVYMKPLGTPLPAENTKKSIIQNNIYIDGVKKSYDEFMSVEASSAYAGGRN